MKIYESLPDIVKKNFKFNNEAKDLFDVSVDISENYNEIPKLTLLAEWVDKNNDDLFVESRAESRERLVRRLEKRMSPIEQATARARARMGLGRDNEGGDENYKWTTEYYVAPVGIESSLNCTYKFISIMAKSKYPNINSARLYILPLLSKTRLVLLSCTALYKPSGWDGEVLVDNNIKWAPYNIELIASDEIGTYLSKLASSFEKEILIPVYKSFNLLTDSKNK